MSWVIAIAGFCALIVLHELGHFAAAKAVGMRVERFSLFFPPTLAHVSFGETDYALGLIPAGGYVRITGMSPTEVAGLPPEVASRAYLNQPPWKRIVVILAGPVVNLIIAFLIFWALLLSAGNGDYTLSNLTNGDAPTAVVSDSVQAILANTAADGVLDAGDKILKVDGRVASVQRVIAAVSADACAGKPVENCRAAVPVELTVKRAKETLTLSVFPRYDATLKRMLIGFDFGVAPAPLSFLGSARVSLDVMWIAAKQNLTAIGRAFTSSKARHQLQSVVGITQDAHAAVAAGSSVALAFLGLLSLILAVINLFPFLPLDGGHILWSVLEKLRGHVISAESMMRFSAVGMVLLVFLVINGLTNDISRLAG